MLNYISIVRISSSFFNATVKLAKFQIKCYPAAIGKNGQQAPKMEAFKNYNSKEH